MKYRNVKNGLVATLVKHDDKCKTTMLELEDGSTKVLSDTTVKRWWKKVDEDEEYVQEVMAQKKELGIECPPIESYEIVSEDESKASDGTPYTQVMQEILQDEKKAVAKARKQRVKTKTQNPEVPGIVEFIDEIAKKADMNFYIREKQPGFKNYRFDEGKVMFTVRIVKHQVEINCKSRDISKQLLEQMQHMNGFFDSRVIIKSLDDNKKLITDIIACYKKEEK